MTINKADSIRARLKKQRSCNTAISESSLFEADLFYYTSAPQQPWTSSKLIITFVHYFLCMFNFLILRNSYDFIFCVIQIGIKRRWDTRHQKLLRQLRKFKRGRLPLFKKLSMSWLSNVGLKILLGRSWPQVSCAANSHGGFSSQSRLQYSFLRSCSCGWL